MNAYLRKSYFKTASLICSSCKSSALLAGFEETDIQTIAAEEYGYHLGMAYQIVDDILDFTGASATLGKPAQADMELGLSTAPILFASDEIEAIKPLIKRRFKEKGDIQVAVQLAQQTACVREYVYMGRGGGCWMLMFRDMARTLYCCCHIPYLVVY